MRIRQCLSMLALMGLSLTCFSTKAGTVKQTTLVQQTGTVIVIAETGPTVDPNSPRTPSVIPCSCVFYEITETLCFSFLYNVGDVTITLSEESAGIVSSNEYSSSTGFVSIPVPGSGSYIISILLESGKEYTGHFVY